MIGYYPTVDQSVISSDFRRVYTRISLYSKKYSRFDWVMIPYPLSKRERTYQKYQFYKSRNYLSTLIFYEETCDWSVRNCLQSHFFSKSWNLIKTLSSGFPGWEEPGFSLHQVLLSAAKGHHTVSSTSRGLYYKIRFCILETQSWNWYPTRFEGQSLKKGSQ